VGSFLTTTLSEATHIIVDPLSDFGRDFVEARFASNFPDASPFVLTLDWMEDSIKNQKRQLEEHYLFSRRAASEQRVESTRLELEKR